jgi:cytochrome c553
MMTKNFSALAAARAVSAVRAAAMIGIAATVSLAAPLASAQGSAEAGRDKKSMCVGCHEIPGYKASFPLVYHVPFIGGQTAQYIEAALQAYKRGDRSHPTMRAIARTLSDQDMADLAAYYAGNGTQ